MMMLWNEYLNMHSPCACSYALSCVFSSLAILMTCTFLWFSQNLAKPDYVRINDISGSETANASLIGPYNEGTVITLVCVSSGGKPVAQLNWYNNSQPLQGKSLTINDYKIMEHLPKCLICMYSSQSICLYSISYPCTY